MFLFTLLEYRNLLRYRCRVLPKRWDVFSHSTRNITLDKTAQHKRFGNLKSAQKCNRFHTVSGVKVEWGYVSHACPTGCPPRCVSRSKVTFVIYVCTAKITQLFRRLGTTHVVIVHLWPM